VNRSKVRIPLFTKCQTVFLASLLLTLPVSGGDFLMQVTDSGYLNTQGFSVILNRDIFHPVFVDEKKAAITEGFHNKMELISRQAYGFRNFENYRLRVKVLCS